MIRNANTSPMMYSMHATFTTRATKVWTNTFSNLYICPFQRLHRIAGPVPHACRQRFLIGSLRHVTFIFFRWVGDACGIALFTKFAISLSSSRVVATTSRPRRAVLSAEAMGCSACPSNAHLSSSHTFLLTAMDMVSCA